MHRDDLDSDFDRHGFALVPGMVAQAACERIGQRLDALRMRKAGTRQLLAQAWCRSLAAELRDHACFRAIAPMPCVAVQCTCFEKSGERNWLVPVHQDHAIPVRQRIDAPGFRGWSEKEGGCFVQAPPQWLERMLAVRLHVDPCLAPDGPLHVVPGTHRLGHIDEAGASALRQERGTVACTARPGDVLFMRPLLLHASSKASGNSRRRVLHFLFGPPDLPHGLRWPRTA